MSPRPVKLNKLGVLMVGAALGGLFAVGLVFQIGLFDGTGSGSQKRALSSLLEDERNTVEVFDASSPSVVNIDPSPSRKDIRWASGQREPGAGTGSGFIWDDSGHIVTNYHVVEESSAVMVTTFDQRRMRAKVVGVDPSKDIAILKCSGEQGNLSPVPLGDDTGLRVGQKVLAIGNPFGLDHTLSAGIVSALDRELETRGGRTIEGVIQTDAAINPGNSGGPLLDTEGRLVGMNTGIVSVSGASAGVGFAVPVSTIERVVPDLIKYGHVRQVKLGIRFLPERVSRRAGIRGLAVGRVMKGSEAEKAGIYGIRRQGAGLTWMGDVVTAADDVPVLNRNDLLNVLDRKQEGDVVVLTLLREGGEVKVRVPFEIER